MRLAWSETANRAGQTAAAWTTPHELRVKHQGRP
jgi:hypothetical protein